VWQDGETKERAGLQQEARALFRKVMEARDGSARRGILTGKGRPIVAATIKNISNV
jgi:hypothetical protein